MAVKKEVKHENTAAAGEWRRKSGDNGSKKGRKVRKYRHGESWKGRKQNSIERSSI